MNYNTFFIWSPLLSFTAKLSDLSPLCLDLPFAWLLLCQPQQTGSVKLLWHLSYCLIYWSLDPLASVSEFDTTEHAPLVQLSSSSTSSHSSSSTLQLLSAALMWSFVLVAFSSHSLCYPYAVSPTPKVWTSNPDIYDSQVSISWPDSSLEILLYLFVYLLPSLASYWREESKRKSEIVEHI